MGSRSGEARMECDFAIVKREAGNDGAAVGYDDLTGGSTRVARRRRNCDGDGDGTIGRGRRHGYAGRAGGRCSERSKNSVLAAVNSRREEESIRVCGSWRLEKQSVKTFVGNDLAVAILDLVNGISRSRIERGDGSVAHIAD